MLTIKYVAVFAFVAVAYAQEYEFQAQARPAPARIQPGFSGPAQAKPTPVPILKQINRHNEDGSYTYGYEGADGSFKIETKLPTGEVKGKYGYVDDTGKVRVVEYGATKYGFEPSGEGITVAPPTLVDETTDKNGNFIDEYQEAPQQARPRIPAAAPAPRPRPSFEGFGSAQQFAPAPQYAPAPKSAVPQRISVPGAQPISANFEFSGRPAAPSFAPARSNFGFAPAPIEENNYEEPTQRPVPRVTYAQPRPQPQPQQYVPQYSGPAATQAISRPQPQPQPQPQYISRPASSGGRPVGGVLDQLAKDYALPQGGAAPLHDISFGYY